LLRKGQFARGRRLLFLDERCKGDQHAVVKAELNASLALARKRRAHFPQALSHRAAHRQADRPAELHPGDIVADCALILARQFVQPFPHRLVTAGGFPKNQGNRFQSFPSFTPAMYHFWYNMQVFFLA
jgi:hypothetical protein